MGGEGRGGKRRPHLPFPSFLPSLSTSFLLDSFYVIFSCLAGRFPVFVLFELFLSCSFLAYCF